MLLSLAETTAPAAPPACTASGQAAAQTRHRVQHQVVDVLHHGEHAQLVLGERGKGGVASPLLANIALNLLDWHLHERGFRFVRYADDFVVLCQSESQAKEARIEVEHLPRERLGLELRGCESFKPVAASPYLSLKFRP